MAADECKFFVDTQPGSWTAHTLPIRRLGTQIPDDLHPQTGWVQFYCAGPTPDWPQSDSYLCLHRLQTAVNFIDTLFADQWGINTAALSQPLHINDVDSQPLKVSPVVHLTAPLDMTICNSWTSLSPPWSHDLNMVFSKDQAIQLPPHHSYDLAINLLPGMMPPKGACTPSRSQRPGLWKNTSPNHSVREQSGPRLLWLWQGFFSWRRMVLSVTASITEGSIASKKALLPRPGQLLKSSCFSVYSLLNKIRSAQRLQTGHAIWLM